MNSITKITATIMLLFSFSSCFTQMKNAKTETVKIYGNCGMCETNIEKAGNLKKTAKVDWNVNTKMATITYDSVKTNLDEILKRIALAGYDSDRFLAPDDVYNNLHGCCKYERVKKTANIQIETTDDHASHSQHTSTDTIQESDQLKAVFDNYFTIKDALVKSDGKLASTLAKDLLALINGVKMDKLSQKEHTVWMKVLGSLKSNAEQISATSNVEKQRIVFMDLSANFYDLFKVGKLETPVYYQHCPMYNDGKGAYWLSRENAVKNPYYGSKMLTCGKTVETIK